MILDQDNRFPGSLKQKLPGLLVVDCFFFLVELNFRSDGSIDDAKNLQHDCK